MPVPLAAKGTYELHHVASFVHRFLSVAVDVARAFNRPAICCSAAAAAAAAAAVVHRNLACRRSRTRGRGFARSLVSMAWAPVTVRSIARETQSRAGDG